MKKDLQKKVKQLEALLREELGVHEQMLEMAKQKRAALRTGNHTLLRDCCERENTHVQAISELEKQRLELVAKMTLLVAPEAPQPLRMDALAQALEEPARGRVLVLRQQLRQRIEEVRKETAVARLATESLMRHMQGLVHTIGGALGGARIYGAQGALGRGATGLSTFSTMG